jgi:hypothetical protein
MRLGGPNRPVYRMVDHAAPLHGLNKIPYILVPNACALPYFSHAVSDEPVPPLDVDEFADAAYDCPAQNRERDLPDSLERTLSKQHTKLPMQKGSRP